MMDETQYTRLSDQNLHGRTVIAADGQVIGEVIALFLVKNEWRVESLQVNLGKDIADRLGAEHSLFHAGALEIPVGMIQSVGDAVLLSVTVNRLREALPNQLRVPSDDVAPKKKKQDHAPTVED